MHKFSFLSQRGFTSPDTTFDSSSASRNSRVLCPGCRYGSRVSMHLGDLIRDFSHLLHRSLPTAPMPVCYLPSLVSLILDPTVSFSRLLKLSSLEAFWNPIRATFQESSPCFFPYSFGSRDRSCQMFLFNFRFCSPAFLMSLCPMGSWDKLAVSSICPNFWYL